MDRFGPDPLDEVLSRMAVRGTDPVPVSQYVLGSLNARRRRNRGLLAAAAATVLLAGGSALALTGGEDPSEVVAPAATADDPSDESTDGAEAGGPDGAATGNGTVVTAVPTTTDPTALPANPFTGTSPPSIAGLNTLAGPPSVGGSPNPPPVPAGGPVPGPAPGGAAPAASATTVPEDRPLSAGALVVAARPAGAVVGLLHGLVEVSLEWSDPDLPAGTVASARVYGTGEDAGGLGGPPLTPAQGACTGGTGTSDTFVGALRLASAGTHTVTVEISTCGGEVETFTADVDVEVPEGLRLQRVTLPVGGTPERGTWRFTPSGGDTEDLRNDDPADEVPNNDERIRQFHNGLPATVLALPEQAGTLEHEVDGDRSCAEVPADADGSAIPMGECA